QQGGRRLNLGRLHGELGRDACDVRVGRSHGLLYSLRWRAPPTPETARFARNYPEQYLRRAGALLFDLPLDQLRTYRPTRFEPDDFDSFWATTLADARQHPLAATFEPVDVGLATVESF